MKGDGRADLRARKRVRRSGRERGGHIYLPAELLGKLADEPQLWYRLDGGDRGRVVVTLYTER